MAFAHGRVVLFDAEGGSPRIVAWRPTNGSGPDGTAEPPNTLVVPVEVHGERLGAIHLHPLGERAFGDAARAITQEAAARFARDLRSSRANVALERASLLLALTQEIDRSALSGEPLTELAARIVGPIRDLVGADRAAINRYDLDRGIGGRLASARTYDARPESTTEVPLDQVLTADYVARPRELAYEDLRDAIGVAGIGANVLLDQGLTAGAVVPIVFDGQLQGGLVLGGFTTTCVEPERLAIAREIAHRLAVATGFSAARDRSAHLIERLRVLGDLDAAILASNRTAEVADIAVAAFRRLARASWAAVATFDDELATGTVLGVWRDGAPTVFAVGNRFPLDGAMPARWRAMPAVEPIPDLVAVLDELPPARGAVEAGLTVGLLVPLICDGRLIGAATLAGTSHVMLERDTLETAREIANRLAVALVGRQSRERLDRAIVRLEGLHELDRRLLAGDPPAEVAAAAASHVRSATGVDRVFVAALDADGRATSLLGVSPPELLQTVNLAPGFSASDLLPRAEPGAVEPRVILDVAAELEGTAMAAMARADGIAAAAFVPVLAGGQAEGLLVLAARTGVQLGGDSLEVAEEVAAQLGLSFRGAREQAARQLSADAFAILHALDQGALAGEPVAGLALGVAEGVLALTGAVVVRLIRYDIEAGLASLIATAGAPVDFPGDTAAMPIGKVLVGSFTSAPQTERFGPSDATPSPEPPGMQALRAQGHGSGAWVPMLAAGRLVGAMVVAGPPEWRLADDRLERATEIASQLAVVVEADRVRREKDQTVARLEFVNRVSRSVLTAESVGEIARVAATRLAQLPGVSRARVLEVDPTAGVCRSIASVEADGAASDDVGMALPVDAMLPPIVWREHRPAIAPDVRTLATSLPFAAAAAAQGFTVAAILPLVAAGELVGAIALAGTDPRLVGDESLGAVDEMADQLSVALAHARTTESLRRALDRGQLVHEIDASILSSASAMEVAGRVAPRLLRLTGARRLDISAYDVARDRGEIIAFAHDGTGHVTPTGEAYQLSEVIPIMDLAAPATVVMRDMRQLADTLPLVRNAVAQGLIAGAWIPLVADGHLLGAIGIAGDSGLLLDEATLGIAREVGDTVAVALQHQRDRAGMAERSARLAMVNDIARAILAADEPESVAGGATRGLLELAGALRIAVYTVSETRTTARLLAFAEHGPALGPTVGDTFPAAQMIPPEVLERGVSVVIRDMAAVADQMRGARMAADAGARAAVVEPMLAGGDLIGCVLVAGSPEVAASEGNIAAVREVAGLLALAIRHAEAQRGLEAALGRQRLVHEIDLAILASVSPDDVAAKIAEPLRLLAGARRLDVSVYDTDRDRGRVLAFAHDGTATGRPPSEEFPLRAMVPMVDHADRGALVARDLRELAPDSAPVGEAIAQGLYRTLWMPLVADGRLLGAIGMAGDDELRIDEVRSGLAREVGDQLAIALLHVRNREELAGRGARLQTIIDESPNGIVVIDARGIIQLANPAAHAMLCAAPGSLAGQSVGVFVPATARAPGTAQFDAWFAAPASSHTHPVDTEARRVDGTTLPVHVLLAPVDTPEGRIAIATIIDLSERALLEARLRQAERLEVLGQFAGVLAHDIRNHLAAVTWTAELMAADLAPDSPQHQDLEIIRNATRDAIAMTRSVLEYARPSGEASGITEVRAHLEGLASMLRRVLGDDVALDVDVADDVPPAGIDATALTQVLVNLASNARDAMPDGGTFRIRAWRHDGLGAGEGAPVQQDSHVHIEVSDTGLGMDEPTRERAFEAFYTTKSTDTGRQGTGLGLSSVFMIVTRAGGTIRVASAPGAGTTFTIDLPIVPPA